MALFHDQEFWFAVAFLILVGLLSRTAVKSGKAALDGRAQKVREELAEAARLRQEAEALVERYRRQQEDAAKSAADILEAATAEAERMRQQGEDELKRTLAAREAQAMDRIAQAEQAALAEVKARAVAIAVRAVTEIIPDLVQGEGARTLVDQAIDELPRRASA
jgi:F-type H+-transporting ATPase subunit b